MLISDEVGNWTVLSSMSSTDSQEPPVWIQSIQFADGTRLSLKPGHVVVIVGPNNVGKSQALRNIDEVVTSRNHHGFRVAQRVSLAFQEQDPRDAIRQWIYSHVPLLTARGSAPSFSRGGTSLQESQLDKYLNGVRSGRLKTIGTMMTLFANAEQRLKLAAKSQPVDVSGTAATSPVQALYGQSDQIEAVSAACKEAFGLSITYDHLADGMWRLRLGELPPLQVDRHGFPETEHREGIRELPAVDEQGDGLRSYVGLLAEFLSSTHLFVLLDEPEAFLHPPQARLLGRHILEFKSKASQLFVATHDANFLRGVLDATPSTPVSVVRLQRFGSKTTARVLEPDHLRGLWDDPLLRYSNVLEGLFHNGVIVCEADPDCRLYESVIQAHDLAQSGTDFMFTQSGGVERIDRIVSALRAVGVPTQVIADADTASKPGILRRLVKALNHEWTQELQQLQTRLSAAARDKASRPIARNVRLEFANGLGGLDDDTELSPGVLSSLSEALRQKSGWEDFKRHGLDAFRGDPHAVGQALFKELATCEIHLVPEGELESWFPDAPGKGASHVREIYERRWHQDVTRCRKILGFLEPIVRRFTRYPDAGP